jgi:hypothetical protein
MIRALKNNFSLDYASKHLTEEELCAWSEEAIAYAGTLPEAEARSKMLDRIEDEIEHKRFLIKLRETKTSAALSQIVMANLKSPTRVVNLTTFLSTYTKIKINVVAFEALIQTRDIYAVSEMLNPNTIKRSVDPKTGDIRYAIMRLIQGGFIQEEDVEKAQRHAGGGSRSLASMVSTKKVSGLN